MKKYGALGSLLLMWLLFFTLMIGIPLLLSHPAYAQNTEGNTSFDTLDEMTKIFRALFDEEEYEQAAEKETGNNTNNVGAQYSASSAGNGEFIPYCQTDPQWQAATNGCIAGAGCAPTAMAQILNYFKNYLPAEYKNLTTPDEVYKLYEQIGDRPCCGCGSNWNWKTWIPTNLGFKGMEVNLVQSGSFNLDLAEKYLDAGCLIVASSAEHVFVVDNVVDKQQRTIQVRNTACCAGLGNTYVKTAEDPTCWAAVNAYAHPVCPSDTQLP